MLSWQNGRHSTSRPSSHSDWHARRLGRKAAAEPSSVSTEISPGGALAQLCTGMPACTWGCQQGEEKGKESTLMGPPSHHQHHSACRLKEDKAEDQVGFGALEIFTFQQG